MNSSRLMANGLILFIAVVLATNTLFVVDQRQQAIVVRFGEAVRVINAVPGQNNAGLQIKAPFLENVILIDKRNQTLEADQEEIIASDQERLVVDAFIRFRVTNPLQYYRTLRDERTAADVADAKSSGAIAVIHAATFEQPGHHRDEVRRRSAS